MNISEFFFLARHPILKIIFLNLLLTFIIFLFAKLIASIKKSLILIFILVFLLRLYLIIVTPMFDNWSDLSIYRSGGKLIKSGINPYDVDDKLGQRNDIRLELMENFGLDKWNKYASANLPLSLLYYGLIESINPNPMAYRLIFATVDSLLVVFIFLFIKRFWKFSPTENINLFFMFLLLSPILLVWGTILPEDKGLQILFMMAAIYFSKSKSKFLQLIISPIILSFSVAFKLFGIILFPLCLSNVYQDLKNANSKNKIFYLGLYTSISLISTIVISLPLLPHLIGWYNFRFSIESTIPTNASPLRLFYLFFLGKYKIFEILLLLGYIIFSIYYLFKLPKKIEFLTTNLLIMFAALMNHYGSLDRVNIAILVSTLLIGIISARTGKYLIYFYSIFGVFDLFFYLLPLILNRFVIQNIQFVESIFVLFFVISYPIIFSLNLLKKK